LNPRSHVRNKPQITKTPILSGKRQHSISDSLKIIRGLEAINARQLLWLTSFYTETVMKLKLQSGEVVELVLEIEADRFDVDNIEDWLRNRTEKFG
jgi:hypothetical protein